MIEAAGGVVWRTSDEGHVEILLIYRSRADDWSLPKGKVRRHESPEDAARREVREETGITCEVGTELASVEYRARKGRVKRVRFWAMQPGAGRFRPNREVDDIAWVHIDHAPRKLTYERDHVVVASLSAALVLRR